YRLARSHALTGYPRRFDHLCRFGASWRHLLRRSAFRRAVLRVGRTQKPQQIQNLLGFLFWRRPTLARPIAVLPSGLQRFTAVFGMGTGGTTALLSPECGTARAARCFRSGASAMSYSEDLQAIEVNRPT